MSGLRIAIVRAVLVGAGVCSGTASCPAQDVTAAPAVVRERDAAVMGTALKIKVLGDDRDELDAAIDAAIAEMRRIEDLMTSWRDSPLTRLNAAAGSGAQQVSTELAAIISRAVEISKITDGAFDCTFAAVGRLWDFKRRPPIVPTAEDVQRQLRLVDSRRIVIDPQNSTVTLAAGMSVGLGGIAKGYGVDQAMKVLMSHGVRHGIVDAGGDMKLLGTDQGETWEVAIKHPRDKERAIAALRVSNTCVVTSGDYERFFTHEGKRYHHILDPRTGYPSTGCISATVVSPSAEFADALATALCVLGPERGLEIVETLQRVEAIVVDLEGNVSASSGLQSALVTRSPQD